MNQNIDFSQAFPKNFDDGLECYLDLWDKGLKKQANQYIQKFLDTFAASMEQSSLNDILENFCSEYFDNEGYSRLKAQHPGSLPHARNKLLWQFLKTKCDMGCMPHMH